MVAFQRLFLHLNALPFLILLECLDFTLKSEYFFLKSSIFSDCVLCAASPWFSYQLLLSFFHFILHWFPLLSPPPRASLPSFYSQPEVTSCVGRKACTSLPYIEVCVYCSGILFLDYLHLVRDEKEIHAGGFTVFNDKRYHLSSTSSFTAGIITVMAVLHLWSQWLLLSSPSLASLLDLSFYCTESLLLM